MYNVNPCYSLVILDPGFIILYNTIFVQTGALLICPSDKYVHISILSFKQRGQKPYTFVLNQMLQL